MPFKHGTPLKCGQPVKWDSTNSSEVKECLRRAIVFFDARRQKTLERSPIAADGEVDGVIEASSSPKRKDEAPPRPVLIIDDNDDDLFFTRRLCAAAGITENIVSLNGAREAVAFLRGLLRAGKRLPAVVFCDVKMVGGDGFEVLRWVRSQRRLARLPFYILSGADHERDKRRALELGADGYLAKFPAADQIAALFSRCE